MSPEVHCNLCNHCYILSLPDPRPEIRCVQYLSEAHKKVPNEFEHQVEPLESGTDIRDPKHHWMSNRDPQTHQMSAKHQQMSERDPKHHMRCHGELQALLQMYIHGGEHQKHIMNTYLIPVESYRLHLIPLALARVIHFIFKL